MATSWTRQRDNTGNPRTTEAGDFRVSENGLLNRISEAFTWAIRAVINTVWNNRTKP